MPRKYEIKGTREFLFWGIGLALFSLWFIKDGWFPSAAVMEKHPVGDSFYLFNKSTGIIMIVSSIVCVYIHKVVR